MTTAPDASSQPFGTMYEVVSHWAKLTPNAPALVADGAAPLSYRGLLESIDSIGADLNGLGIGRNDRVAIVHPGGRDMALTILGIWSYATPVPLNPESTLGELAIQMRDMRVNALAIAEDMDTPARHAAEMLDLPILELSPDGRGGMAITAKSHRITPVSDRTGPVQPDDIVAVIATSGTTSHSKVVPIRHRQLVCRNSYVARSMELGAEDRSLNMLRLYHSGGLNQGLSTPLIVGGSLGVLTDFSVSGFFRALESLEPTWGTGAYTFYHAIHRQLSDYRCTIERVAPRLRFLRSGTGPLNPTIAEELERAFDTPLIMTYGTSESGSITCEHPPPVRRKRGSVGTAVHDGVAIVDEAGEAVDRGAEGEVAVRGPAVFDGYENDEAANRSAFVNGWYRSGDLGYFDADGYLFITGRIKELINRGGQKISPNEIDDALLAHPKVAAASAFPVPHPTLGEEVAAAVVLEDGTSMDEASLLAFLRESLAEYKVPRRLVFVGEIPKGPTGKVQRHKLASAFGLAGEAEAIAIADEDRPATALESQLQALWASALGRAHVGLHDDFFLLGGDSLQAVELFLRIEKTLGRPLPRSVLFDAGTVAEMAKRIESSPSMRCLVAIQPSGSRPNFFCVHGVSGQVLSFRDLARYLGEDQPFYGIQSVGLDGAETPLARIEDMAARYIAEMRQLQPKGPYYLGGYSMGGWIAYEMARQLREAGQAVGMLALLDTQSRRGRRRATLSNWFRHHWYRLSELQASAVAPYVALRFRNLAVIIGMAVRYRLFTAAWRLGEAYSGEMPRFLRRPIDVNKVAIRLYEARPHEGDAVLFKASPLAWTHTDSHEGWRDLIGGDLEIRPVSGQHFKILEEPNVPTLARALADCLNERQRRQTREIESLAMPAKAGQRNF